jgi:hypothetical protein
VGTVVGEEPMPPRKPARWYAELRWRGGSAAEPPSISPILAWKLLKSYLDGVLTGHAAQVQEIVIRPAGETGHSPDSGAESE